MPRIRDTDPQRISDRIADLEDAPLAGGKLKEVALVSGDNRIRHGLTRARGRVVVSISAATTLFDKVDSDPGVWVINSSAAASAVIYFF